MNLVCPDAAKIANLTVLNGDATGGYYNGYVVLFTNDYTPDNTTLLSDLTLATFSGYSPQSLSGLSTPTINGSDQAQSDAASVAWALSGTSSGDLYGFAILNNAQNLCLLAGRFDSAPINVPDGSTLTIYPSTLVTSIY